VVYFGYVLPDSPSFPQILAGQPSTGLALLNTLEKPMRSIHLLAAVFVVACCATPVMATPILNPPGFVTGLPGLGDPFIFNFDENGNATYSLNGDPTLVPVLGTLEPDPLNSNLLALRYALPGLVSPGDVGIYEPDGITPSDGLRFQDIAGVSYMFFYSADIGGGMLADTGLGNLDLSFVGALESGDSFQFCSAGPGNPCSANNIYNGQSPELSSPEVPEPSTILLLLSGGVVGFRRLRSRMS
jgi:hypothetical protein